MSMTENQCLKLRSAIYACCTNKDEWNNLFKEDKLNLEVDISSYPKKEDLDNIKSQYTGIKILILEATDKDLFLEHEYNSIVAAIKNSSSSNSFTIFKERVISADEISQQIAEKKPDIVHFCGHGLEDGSFSLCRETVRPEFLESKLSFYKNRVKCVIFNTCHSEKVADIISPHIDYVISMNSSIIDVQAIHFAKSFYSGLVQAYSDGIDIFLTGFVEGIIALINDDYSQELIPILKIRYEKAVLNLIKSKDAEGKIDDLIKILIFHFPINKLFTEFYHDYSYPIKKDDLNQLVEIIRGLQDWNLVRSSYINTLPQYSTTYSSELNNLGNIDDIINSLRIEYPFVSDKVPSILDFTKNLAGNFEENSQEYQKIKSWVEEVAAKLNISIIVKPKVKSRLSDIYTYLLIIVNDEGNKFNLRAEYILEDENLTIIQQTPLNLPEQKEQTGITCDSFNEIPHQVKKYYDELVQELSNNHLNNIQIELFLPIQYLIKNIDKEWFIDDDLSGLTPIVRERNIVLRPSERLKKKEFCVKLQNNFERFNESLKGYSDEDIVNKEIEIVNQKVVDSNFQKISDSFKDKKIGVKLIYNGIPEIAFFRAIIRGAIGIAFWRRCSIPEDSNFSDIDNHLKLDFFNNNCRNLVEKMYELRKEASYDENNDENYYPLGFLCDNPNRIPNIKPFKSF